MAKKLESLENSLLQGYVPLINVKMKSENIQDGDFAFYPNYSEGNAALTWFDGTRKILQAKSVRFNNGTDVRAQSIQETLFEQGLPVGVSQGFGAELCGATQPIFKIPLENNITYLVNMWSNTLNILDPYVNVASLYFSNIS